MMNIKKEEKNCYQLPLSNGIFLNPLEEVNVPAMRRHCLTNELDFGASIVFCISLITAVIYLFHTTYVL